VIHDVVDKNGGQLHLSIEAGEKPRKLSNLDAKARDSRGRELIPNGFPEQNHLPWRVTSSRAPFEDFAYLIPTILLIASLYTRPFAGLQFMPPSITDKSRENHPPEKPSLVDTWLDGLPRLSPLQKDATTTRVRDPLQSTQPRSTILRRASARKRKRAMNEDESNNYGSEPRRSCRIKVTRKTEKPGRSDNHSHSALQPRPKRPSPGTASAITTQPVLDRDDKQNSDNVPTNLPLRNERIILGNTSTPEFPPPSSPTRTETTKTSSRSSPSRLKGVKRENLVNLSPAIKFETVAEGKKHWPPHIQDLWRDRVSSLVHETKVVPRQLKVSRF
jgi:hypothetical protein